MVSVLTRVPSEYGISFTITVRYTGSLSITNIEYFIAPKFVPTRSLVLISDLVTVGYVFYTVPGFIVVFRIDWILI